LPDRLIGRDDDLNAQGVGIQVPAPFLRYVNRHEIHPGT